MADNMAEMGARMGEKADTVAEQAKETASRYAQQAKDYAQQGYEYAAGKSKVVKESTQSFIEENPWTAIGIALGVGVLAGLLLRGSGSRD